MKGLKILLLAGLVAVGAVQAEEEGLITKQSAYSADVTLDRLEKALEQQGITVALRWSHSERARAAGIELRPTELIVFGNPKLGSHLFTSRQTSGIDLPMKALAWEDASGQTWLTYNDPAYIADRHDIDDRPEIVEKMTRALDSLTDRATAPETASKR